MFSLLVSIVGTSEDGLFTHENSLSVSFLFWVWRVNIYRHQGSARLHSIATEQVLFLKSRYNSLIL